jgi:hypothetical protein
MAKDHSTVSRDDTRRAALEMLGEGVATLSEVARLAGVDRQLVRHWAMRASIDPGKARAQLLAKLWNKRRPRS